jgi:hypothetical protein
VRAAAVGAWTAGGDQTLTNPEADRQAVESAETVTVSAGRYRLSLAASVKSVRPSDGYVAVTFATHRAALQVTPA